MKKTVLWVDDELGIPQGGKEFLEFFDYEVLIAGSGKEAIEIYRDQWLKIGMVILDVIMPEMNGVEVLREMRAINPLVKCLFLSGMVPPELHDFIKGEKILKKPVKMDFFRQKLEELI